MLLLSILAKKGSSVTKKDEAPEFIFDDDIDLRTRLGLPRQASCMSEMFPWVLNLLKRTAVHFACEQAGMETGCRRAGEF